MNILHVWDIAGVGSILAKEQNRLGHTAHVLMAFKKYNPFAINDFYGFPSLQPKNKIDFVLTALKAAADYDIIHLHSMIRILPLFRLKYPKKKLVLHLHGSDARANLSGFREISRKLSYRMADRVLVSTPDLQPLVPVESTYIPTPVDTEHFKPERRPTDSTALYFTMPYIDKIDIELLLERQGLTGLSLKIHDRKNHPIQYCDLPQTLSQYEYFVDVKVQYGKPLQAMSKTGLEALAMNRIVIDHQFRRMWGLPQHHESRNVVVEVMKAYEF